MKVQIEELPSDYYSSDNNSTNSGVTLHKQGGLCSNKHVKIAFITDYPTITVHTGKCYKALTDSVAAISLVRYSMYQNIDINLKTAIQTTSIQLNTADGSPMTALGITTLQLRIADFKFSHKFIIYDRDREKNCYIQKGGRFLTYTRNCEQKTNIAVVKSALKILPRHNGIIPIKIKGHVIKGLMPYSIGDQDSKKRERPQYTHHWWNP